MRFPAFPVAFPSYHHLVPGPYPRWRRRRWPQFWRESVCYRLPVRSSLSRWKNYGHLSLFSTQYYVIAIQEKRRNALCKRRTKRNFFQNGIREIQGKLESCKRANGESIFRTENFWFCVLLCFQKVAPLISSGMMKKLEPVLQFQRRTMHCRPLATIKPLNATQDRIQSHTKKGKEPDVYCFPSSPRESGTKQTSSSKGEREKETKATKKTKKVLKVRLIL